MEHDIKNLNTSEWGEWLENQINNSTFEDIQKKYIDKLSKYISHFELHRYGYKTPTRQAGKVFDYVSPEDRISFEVHQFEDEWFALLFWVDYNPGQAVQVSYYICDQFDAVIHQLNICMRGQKKIKDSSWNETIDKDLEEKKQLLIKKVSKKILSFKNFKEINDLNGLIFGYDL
jgi:hypothetical protein